MEDSHLKSQVIIKIVYIDVKEHPNKIRQARLVVDTVLEMLKASRYPVDQIKVEIKCV